MQILPVAKLYKPIGTCIYCGTKEGPLTDEHIIPFGLGGTLVLPKASCPTCARTTANLEQTIQRSMLGPLRIRLGLPTRRPKQRPKELEIHLIRDGRVVRKNVHASEIPLSYFGVKLPPPRILLGLPPAEKVDFEVIMTFDDNDRRKYMGVQGQGFSPGYFDLLIFYRFLAKIAHAFAVGQLGIDRFQPSLPDIILGKADLQISNLFQLVGGGDNLPEARFSDSSTKELHRLQVHGHDETGVEYILISIRLFSFLNAPTYYVVVGKDRGPST